MAWIYLLIAGIFEVCWAVAIKYCDGFKPTFSLFFVIISMTLSMVFLWLATRNLPMSIAYAVWVGIGVVGVFAYGILFLKEPISIINMLFMALILTGIIGLKLSFKS
jgi:quaternary ammonium compound-resistance protein SugE